MEACKESTDTLFSHFISDSLLIFRRPDRISTNFVDEKFQICIFIS